MCELKQKKKKEKNFIDVHADLKIHHKRRKLSFFICSFLFI